jgi:lipopolysaccharide/colanic/teichoic acid biosynthesis glycosyltransferase
MLSTPHQSSTTSALDSDSSITTLRLLEALDEVVRRALLADAAKKAETSDLTLQFDTPTPIDLTSQLQAARRYADQTRRLSKRLDRRSGSKRVGHESFVELTEKGWITGRKGGTAWCLSRTKRMIDAALALVILALLSPIFALIAIAIKLDSPGPVFFRQSRTGYRGRRFGMLKFRSMCADAEKLKASLQHLNRHSSEIDFKVVDDPRITRVGKYLRRSSLDELPNLINVVTGEMRLVGPRPTSFGSDTYLPWHVTRLAVPPGITGLWQISGRSQLDFHERVMLDVRYIDEQSPITDLKILALTPVSVVRGKGAC